MPDYFLQHWWPCVATWAGLFVMDYAMTIRCARLYKSGVCEKFVFEGSYEITPMFQKDIDNLRTISPRFLAVLALNGTLLVLLWALLADNPSIYTFFAGALIGVQLAIHVRHLHNFVAFRIAATDAIRGRIEYLRAGMLKISAAELMAVSAMFAGLAAITLSWFLAGASFGAASAAWKHYRLARKESKKLLQQVSAATAD